MARREAKLLDFSLPLGVTRIKPNGKTIPNFYEFMAFRFK